MALIFSFINCQWEQENELENGKFKTFSIKANVTYYAFIKAEHGQKITIELSLDSSFQKSPFRYLNVNEYNTRYGIIMDSYSLILEGKIKNNKFVLSGDYHINWIGIQYINLEFKSSCDISNLQIKIKVEGMTSEEGIGALILIFILIPIIICLIVCAIIIAVSCGLCCSQKPPAPQYTVQQPLVYTPLQPQPQIPLPNPNFPQQNNLYNQ